MPATRNADRATILKLRAIISNGHWDECWTYHLTNEHQRVHQSRYANNEIPHSA